MKDPYTWSIRHGLGFSIPKYSQGGDHFKEAPAGCQRAGVTTLIT